MHEQIFLMLGEQLQRDGQQQLQMAIGIIEGNAEILLHSADAVQNGVPMGVQPLAGFLQRVVAQKIGQQRLAVLGVLGGIVMGQCADLRRDQIGPILQAAQHHQCVQLFGAHAEGVGGAQQQEVHDLVGGGVDLRQRVQAVQRGGDHHAQVVSLNQRLKGAQVVVPV